jgi:hypothetical protein
MIHCRARSHRAHERGSSPCSWGQGYRELALRVLGYASLGVILVLGSCGAPSPAKGSRGSAGASLTPTAADQQTIVAGQPLGPTDPSTVGLNVQSDGFGCGRYVYAGGYLGPQRAVVAATDRLGYDAGEAQQIRAFVNAYWQHQQPTLPSTLGLQWVALAAQSLATTGAECVIAMQVTNTGSGTVEIQSLGVRLLSDARPSQDRIRLIEQCSLLTYASLQQSTGCPPSLGGGPGSFGGCSVPGVQLALVGGSAGTVYKVKGPLGSSTCPLLALAPRETTDMSVQVYSPSAFAYSLAVEMDLARDGNLQTLTLTRQEATLTFATAAQLTCSRLQGTSLIPQAVGEDVFNQVYGWCY